MEQWIIIAIVQVSQCSKDVFLSTETDDPFKTESFSDTLSSLSTWTLTPDKQTWDLLRSLKRTLLSLTVLLSLSCSQQIEQLNWWLNFGTYIHSTHNPATKIIDSGSLIQRESKYLILLFIVIASFEYCFATSGADAIRWVVLQKVSYEHTSAYMNIILSRKHSTSMLYCMSHVMCHCIGDSKVLTITNKGQE